MAGCFDRLTWMARDGSHPWLLRGTVCRGTVLLLLLIGSGGARADGVGIGQAEDTNVPELRVFEFTCDLQRSTGPLRLSGLMASDGYQHRVATYWVEPAAARDMTSFLRCADFIFAPDSIHYWIEGMTERGMLPLPAGPPLPQGRSLESEVRAALAILTRIERPHKDESVPLEVAQFFHTSRGRPEYTYQVLPEVTDGDGLARATTSSVRILNALPYGREYSKETRSDSLLVWRAARALGGQLVAGVIVKPSMDVPKDKCLNAFDVNSLGRWSLIPEPYRVYWRFHRACSELREPAHKQVTGRKVCQEIESYLEAGDVPSQVCRGLDRLRFRAASMTDDANCVQRSAQAMVAGLCGDSSVGPYQCFLELGRISAHIGEQYPEQAEDWLRPFVGQMVSRAGRDGADALERLMDTIDANNWFTYGMSLLEEIRKRGSANEDAMRAIAARIEALCMARTRRPPDPCETSATVREYLARLHNDPPQGEVGMTDVRHILDRGLANQYVDRAARTALVEDVIRSIRLIVGGGPFRGDPATLIASIDRFSALYLLIGKEGRPMNTALATFLALSFCDISTPEDHDALISQFCRRSNELQSEINAMLSHRRLTSLVTGQDVEAVLRQCERLLCAYIDDPFYPAFKFPWTRNEEDRLAGILRLHLMELASLLDETALKVQYGGACAELKDKTVSDISRIVQRLLPEAAFLRTPPYPGVSCHYRGGSHGLTATLDPMLYRQDDRARERFVAMKHFHLGHRLEELTKQEARLAEPPKLPLNGGEATTALRNVSPQEQESNQ